jgi:hypothetical protein
MPYFEDPKEKRTFGFGKREIAPSVFQNFLWEKG